VFSKWEARQTSLRAQEAQQQEPEPGGASTPSIPPLPLLSGRPRLNVLRDSYISLAQVLRAGIPIQDALEDLGKGARGRWSQCLTMMSRRVREGASLSEAMEEQPQMFRLEETQLIYAAERLGNAATAFESLALGVQSRIDAKRQLIRSISYPIFLVLLTVLMMPLPELFKGGSGDYFEAVSRQLLVVAVIALVVLVVLPWLVQFPGIRTRLKKLAWSLPWPATLYVHHVRGLYARVLGSNLNSGLALYESVRTASNVSQDPVLARRSGSVMDQLVAGEKLSGPMAQLQVLDASDNMLVIAGERSGNLPDSLEQIALRHEDAVRRGTKTLIQVVTVLVTMISMIFITMEIVDSYQNITSGAEQMLQQIKDQSPFKDINLKDLKGINLEGLDLMDPSNESSLSPWKNLKDLPQ
jgi:type II secretory pathway component PulF